MKYFHLFFLCVFALASGFCQNSMEEQSFPSHKLEWLQSKLELTSEQVNILKTKWQTVEGREAKRALILEVMTPEQAEKFAGMRKRGHRGHKLHRTKGHHKNRHHKHHTPHITKKHYKPHRQHMDDETRSKLIEMRTELEAVIAEEDKLRIQELRAFYRTANNPKQKYDDDWENLTEDERVIFKKEWINYLSSWQQYYSEVREMADQYEVEIKSLFDKNEDFFENKWTAYKINREAKCAEYPECADRKKTKDENREARKQKADRIGKGKTKRVGKQKTDHKHPYARYGKFLLMEADVPSELKAEESKDVSNILALAPNPAAQQTTLSYVVSTDSNITLELRDEQGRIVTQLSQEFLTAGSYQKTIDTSDLTSRIYFVTLWDGNELISEKLIVQQ